MVRLICVCQVAWRFGRAPKDWQIDHPHTQKGSGVNEPTTAASLCLVSQEECKPRCREKIESKLGDTQCCFRCGRRATDQISVPHQICEKSCEHAKDVYTCFVDLGKVYGWVPREKL